MPGTTTCRGPQVSHALGCRKLLPRDIDACVRKILELVKRVQPLGIPENAEEHTVDTPETAAFLRKLGSDGLVLLKNENETLPFKKSKTTAVIGPNAALAAYSGGGSASLAPYYAVTPLEGIKAQCSNASYSLGAPGWKKLPLMSHRTKTADGKAGLTMKVFLDPPSKPQRQQIDEVYVSKSDILLVDYKHEKLPEDHLYYVTLTGTFTPEETAEYEFSLSVAGIGKVYVDGEMIIDNETKQTPGDSFFGSGTVDETGRLHMEKGKSYAVQIDFGTLPLMKFRTAGTTGFGAGGLRAGLERVVDYDVERDRAVKLAKEVDQVVLCMGLNSDWESEGYDREHMDLPPGSDELVKAVCAANPNTVVVIQSGTPVTMTHWLSDAKAIVQAWYGGNETGNAIADIVFGERNPSGKLPLSFPLKNEDNPAFLNYRSERGRVIYGEDVYVGYRFYEKTKKEVAFPFGHGLSYTTFKISDLSVADSEREIEVSASVENTGGIEGREVVQVYVSQVSPSIGRPVKEFKGFKKVGVKAGGKETVTIKLNKKYASSFFDEETDSWIMEEGKYVVFVGNSSAKVEKAGEYKVAKTEWWTGL
jgi:beta-glucosidase